MFVLYDEEGMSRMIERKIKLSDTEEVKEFVNAAGKCDFEIDVFYNRAVIDAKSLLGMLYLGVCKELTIKYGESLKYRFESWSNLSCGREILTIAAGEGLRRRQCWRAAESTGKFKEAWVRTTMPRFR